MLLQAWAEGHSRDWSRTWWGLQEYEVKEWFTPCLSQTINYWVKYQYLATIYSKERDIWPQTFYWPERFVHPRPWRMECNCARTQCTIGLARRACQELTGWTELCQSHYDNKYNTYAHAVVWNKNGGVWRRSLGGGSTCAEIVLGHNLRHRKSIMDVIVPFIRLKTAVEPKPLQSLIIMTTNSTTISEPVQGYVKLVFGHFWIRRWELPLSLFASYLMGRVNIDWRRSLMVALWPCVDTIALVLEVLLSGPHSTRRAPAKIVTAIMEALLAFGVIAYLRQLTLSLKRKGKWTWLAKLIRLLQAPMSKDARCQSLLQKAAKTSVTTKSVTCQISAGDDEEQHQPASLEELISQTSATGDAMQDETGPPQLSHGLLAEVMSAIPPQPFSSPMPLPPILLPMHSPVDTSHMDGSGSPQLMGLRHHLSSRRSLCHLPF
ncbi:hypothetical protein CRENBAI_003801 [Crenichthys baileyi]|uniref:Uncharacterized protein n=1 Tax=Crenichthys baileyi TaxID=28760 RepID=A0AAV9SMA3_9TELE